MTDVCVVAATAAYMETVIIIQLCTSDHDLHHSITMYRD